MTTKPTKDNLGDELEEIFKFMWREASSTRLHQREIEARAKAQITQLINRAVEEQRMKMAVKHAAIESSLDQEIMILKAKLKQKRGE